MTPGDWATIDSQMGWPVGMYMPNSGAWRLVRGLPDASRVLVIAVVSQLFEDRLPGCLIMPIGDSHVGWVREDELHAGLGSETIPPSTEYGFPYRRWVYKKRTRWKSLPTGTQVCSVCSQWMTYSTGNVGPCCGSSWPGPGWKDPTHDWVQVIEGGPN